MLVQSNFVLRSNVLHSERGYGAQITCISGRLRHKYLSDPRSLVLPYFTSTVPAVLVRVSVRQICIIVPIYRAASGRVTNIRTQERWYCICKEFRSYEQCIS